MQSKSETASKSSGFIGTSLIAQPAAHIWDFLEQILADFEKAAADKWIKKLNDPEMANWQKKLDAIGPYLTSISADVSTRLETEREILTFQGYFPAVCRRNCRKLAPSSVCLNCSTRREKLL